MTKSAKSSAVVYEAQRDQLLEALADALYDGKDKETRQSLNSLVDYYAKFPFQKLNLPQQVEVLVGFKEDYELVLKEIAGLIDYHGRKVPQRKKMNFARPLGFDKGRLVFKGGWIGGKKKGLVENVAKLRAVESEVTKDMKLPRQSKASHLYEQIAEANPMRRGDMLRAIKRTRSRKAKT